MFILFLLIIAVPFFIRWLRWLALLQQKEYRFDRLLAHLGTKQGLADLFGHLIPKAYELSKTGLKRPKITHRIVLTALISLTLISSLTFYFWQQTDSFLLFALEIILLHFLSPIWVSLASVPTQLLKKIYVKREESKAQTKLLQHNPKIIAITGSYGKTATKLIVSHCLNQKYSVFSPPKSHNNRYSLAQAINQTYTDQKLAVLEYGAYKKGEIKHLCQTYPPEAGIITGLTDQHLAIFGSRDNIIQAKSELVRSLGKNQSLFINGQDPGAKLIAQAGQAQAGEAQKVIDYSGPESKIQVDQVSLNQEGRLRFSWQDHLVQTQLVGQHYLASCLAAIALGQHYQLTTAQIIDGLETFVPSDYMVSLKILDSGPTIIDDGRTSNPKGFKAALNLTQEIAKHNSQLNKKILITAGLVDLGSKSKQVHQELAKAAQDLFEFVIYVGDDGKNQFKRVFAQKLIEDRLKVLKLISEFDQETLVLIEGKIPLWLRRKLDTLLK